MEGEGVVWALYKDADPIPKGCSTPDLLSSPRPITGVKATAPLSAGWAAEPSGRVRRGPGCRAQSCALPPCGNRELWQCQATTPVNATVTPDGVDRSDCKARLGDFCSSDRRRRRRRGPRWHTRRVHAQRPPPHAVSRCGSSLSFITHELSRSQIHALPHVRIPAGWQGCGEGPLYPQHLELCLTHGGRSVNICKRKLIFNPPDIAKDMQQLRFLRQFVLTSFLAGTGLPANVSSKLFYSKSYHSFPVIL